MSEIWKPVVGYEGYYEVSNEGRVKSLHRGREYILRPGKHTQGYQTITLAHQGEKARRLVHQIVLEAFVGPPDVNEVCRHYPDPDKTNNNLDNLQWATQKTNLADRREHGTERIGEAHPGAKLNNNDVRDIKRLIRETTLSNREIGDRFGVCPSNISRIRLDQTWRHI